VGLLVKAGKLMVRIRARKTCHFSGFIFQGFSFWEFWEFGSVSSSLSRRTATASAPTFTSTASSPAAASRVINVKATPKVGTVSGINLVDEASELMVISQFGKIIRIDAKSIRAAGHSTQGVKLLDIEPQDKVATAVVIPPEEAKTQPEEGTLLRNCCSD
jgi:hypothetical protein